MIDRQKLTNLLNSSSYVQRVEVDNDFIKIYTNILLGASDDYLNVYLIFEEGEMYLSDGNNIYMILDDYYEIEKDELAKLAKVNKFEFDNHRFLKQVTPKNLLDSLEKLQEIVNQLLENKRR